MVETEREVEPKFNFALDTLERLSSVLRRISILQIVYPNDLNARQNEYIGLIKQLYLVAIPLLDETMINKYKDEILDFKMDIKLVIKSKIQTMQEMYSATKEKRLNEILVNLQFKLRRFLMPQGESDDYEL